MEERQQTGLRDALGLKTGKSGRNRAVLAKTQAG